MVLSFLFMFHAVRMISSCKDTKNKINAKENYKKTVADILIQATAIISFTITNMLQKNQLLTNYYFTMKKNLVLL